MEHTDGINEARDARGLSGRGDDSMNHVCFSQSSWFPCLLYNR